MTDEILPPQTPASPYVAYLEDCKRPIVCLIFTMPLFIIYHLGIYIIDEKYRNGADFLITKLLQAFGYGGHLLSFVLVLLVLGLQQQYASTPWSKKRSVFFWMTAESLLFALPIFIIYNVLNRFMQITPIKMSVDVGAGSAGTWYAEMILSIGAGIYEEFLFRLVLMGGLIYLAKIAFGRLCFWSLCFIMLFQAIAFSAFHHIPGAVNSLFSLEVFAFRTLCGVYFAYIFLTRGFGIVAGAHAFYDLIVLGLKAIPEA